MDTQSKRWYFIIAGIALALALVLSTTSYGQVVPVAQLEDAVNSEQTKPATMAPVFNAYRGVKIGMSVDAARDAVKQKPKVDDKDGLLYMFSDDELAQLVIGADKSVNTISVTYNGDDPDAPTLEEVFGPGVTPAPGANGKIYKMVRYQEAGYWIAYSRTAGEKPTVSLTLQKL